MKMMKRMLAAAAAVLWTVAALAQTQIKVQAPNMVAEDEQFNVVFKIDGENSPSSFSWTPGDDLKLIWGPQKGSSRSVQIINGKRSESSTTTYTYVLMPKKKGTIHLPQAAATIGGNTITSGPFSIEVVGSQPSQQGSSSSSSSSQGYSSRSSSVGEVSSDDIFLRLSLSKTDVVLGEPVTATLKLYTRVQVSGFEDATFPKFNGFYNQELQSPSQVSFQRAEYNGTLYDAAVLRSWTLIPQQTGKVSIDPAELICLVNVRTPAARTGSMLDDFFMMDDVRTVRKRVSTSAVKINVSELPSGAPASFCGGVGSFEMNAVISRDTIAANDAASLVVTVKGKGNIALTDAPKVSFPADFEVYDSKNEQSIDKNNGGISGTKTFEYPFIARSGGRFAIGPVEYSWYDPSAGKYKTAVTDTLWINVKKAAGTDPVTAIPGTPSVRRDAVADLGQDIRFITSDTPDFSSRGTFFAGTAAFWLIIAALALLAVLVCILASVFSARKADVAGTRNRKASSMARKRLKKAGEYLDKDLYTPFYEELHKALLGYVSDKLMMNAADMSKDNISETLTARAVSPELAQSFTGLLDACEFARYSPDAGSDAMRAHFEESLRTITAIDSTVKSVKKSVGATVAALALLLVPSFMMSAQAPDSLWVSGVEAYKSGQYEQAAQTWQEIESQSLESPELYCNIADAQFKSGNIGKAVLYYERALKLDPSYEDARTNLEFAEGFVQDKIEAVPEFFLTSAARSVSYLMTSNTWALVAIVLFALAMAAVVLFVLSRMPAARKTGFFGAIVFILLAVMSFCFSMWQKNIYEAEDGAVVMASVSEVKSAPAGDDTTSLFLLHEGTEVTIIGEESGWYRISLADKRQGWIAATDIEII